MARHHPAHAINLSRALFAAPLFALLAWAQGDSFSVSSYQLLMLTLSIISSYSFGDILFLWAARTIGIPTSLAIASSYPLWSALVGWGVRGEQMALSGWGGLLLLVLSLATVIRTGATQVPHGLEAKDYLKGVLCSVAVSLLWSLNTVSVSEGSVGLGAATSNAIRMTLGIFLCPLIGIPLTGRKEIFLPWRVTKKYSWVFLLEGFGGSLFYAYGLVHSSLATGAALSSLSPILTVPWVLWQGKERFSWLRLLAIVGVIAGAWLLVAATHEKVF
jgi:drug/metabolite transporter (DMT)-like permease